MECRRKEIFQAFRAGYDPVPEWFKHLGHVPDYAMKAGHYFVWDGRSVSCWEASVFPTVFEPVT